jgi:hypothetical protein
MSTSASGRPAAEQNAVLSQLNALVGEWEMQVLSLDGDALSRGRTVFEWLEGGAFLIQHANAEALSTVSEGWAAASPFPVTTIIGLDDSAERFSMLYADARGVFRVYQMTLGAGVWTLRRDAPGFFQRFSGKFSDADDTISGRWDSSNNGENWEPDFELTYTRVR